MCQFAESVERFTDLVLSNEEKLLICRDFSKMVDALYELYHGETENVEPSKSNSRFQECLTGLITLHKNTGGFVRTNQHGYCEFHSSYGDIENLNIEEKVYRVYVNASTRNVIVLGRLLVKKVHIFKNS